MRPPSLSLQPAGPAALPVAVTGYGALRPLEMYHLAPLEVRDAVAQGGLDFRSARLLGTAFSRPKDRGNYLWDNYASATGYQGFWQGRLFDLYKVQVSGLALLHDPLGVPGAWFTTERIGPDRLTRVVLAQVSPPAPSAPSGPA